MEGNPWIWEVNKWILHDNYDIAKDFPNIRTWEMRMTSAKNKLCFRHIRKRESVENEKTKMIMLKLNEYINQTITIAISTIILLVMRMTTTIINLQVNPLLQLCSPSSQIRLIIF